MSKLSVLVIVALSLALLGCKHTPGYVGSYAMAPSDAMKQEIAKLPKAQQDQAQKVMDSLAKLTVTINADGTFAMTDPTTGKESKGTYTADGNKLTISSPDSKIAGSQSPTLTYNEADQSLTTGQAGAQGALVFKKK